MIHSVPKPPRTPKKAKKPLRAVNPARRRSEFIRCYHSRERVAFVNALPCVVCGRVPSENAHIDTEGMGRKSGYTKIAPLCGEPFGPILGCHPSLHQLGRASFEALLNVDLTKCAADTEKAWQSYQAEFLKPGRKRIA